jgi:transposase-like protein
MSQKRRQYTAEFKFKVALEAAKGRKTISELASEMEVHPKQIRDWKRQLLEAGASLFLRNRNGQQHEHEGLQAELDEQIGRLKMELEWLKKRSARFG